MTEMRFDQAQAVALGGVNIEVVYAGSTLVWASPAIPEPAPIRYGTDAPAPDMVRPVKPRQRIRYEVSVSMFPNGIGLFSGGSLVLWPSTGTPPLMQTPDAQDHWWDAESAATWTVPADAVPGTVVEMRYADFPNFARTKLIATFQVV